MAGRRGAAAGFMRDFFGRLIGPPAGAPGPPRPPPAPPGQWAGGYIAALLTATLALVVRAALDPVLGDIHTFALPMLTVVFVAWWFGLGPGLAGLLVSMVGTVYFFVAPRGSFDLGSPGERLELVLFALAGVGCAVLG